MLKKLKNCHNTDDFRMLAKQNLPSPVFHYIDGAADDEVTYARNTCLLYTSPSPRDRG